MAEMVVPLPRRRGSPLRNAHCTILIALWDSTATVMVVRAVQLPLRGDTCPAITVSGTCSGGHMPAGVSALNDFHELPESPRDLTY